MSTSTARSLRPSPSVAATIVAVGDDAYVLPERLTDGAGSCGPRFGDDVWDFRPFVPRTTRQTRNDFSVLADPIAVRTVKEFLYSRIRRGTSGSDAGHRGSARPMKLTNVHQTFIRVVAVIASLQHLGAVRLADVTREHLEAALARWKGNSLESAAQYVTAVKHLAAHGAFLSQDRLGFSPWLGRPANAVVGLLRDRENATLRIPEHVSGPLVKAAVFYVETASGDLLAVRRTIEALDAARAGMRLGGGQTRARLVEFIARRRADGRGIPALPRDQAHTRPGAAIVDGVIQSPNCRLVCLLAGVGDTGSYRQLLTDAAEELGYEPGDLDIPISAWPDAGRPWRADLDPCSIQREIAHLRIACWIVIAYLSGMRDTEVRELGRECAFTEPGDDGRLRHKLRGRVFKKRKLTGDEAQWVVLDVVHRAVAILLEINDDPTHLFGYHGGPNLGYVLVSSINRQLGRFRDHANELFSTPNSLFVPNDTPTGDPHLDAGGGRNTRNAGVPWPLDNRQFRRTLAWHIAHQPFGVVAGARQYQHAKIMMFEGYAGTSASGFAAEVAAEETVAKLDYLEDLYRDWNDGGRASGGATARIDTEFGRIRRELGDLPGVVANPARLRTMLAHLTKVLHPGVLNDCFHQPATAVCAQRAKALDRPLPLHNMCSVCPNARRTAVHLPRLTTARDQAREALTPLASVGSRNVVELPPLQRAALTDYVAGFDRLIAELGTQEEAPA